MSTPSTKPHTREEVEASQAAPFTRNEYFHGKLMTARDMQIEQDYHRARLHAVSQSVLGSGLVCGLEAEVRTARTDDGSLRVEVYVHPGLAIDREGRPIRVTSQRDDREQWTTATYVGDEDEPPTDADVVAVYLRYKECFTDAVPVPDVTNACEERCCYNRVIEQFDVTYTLAEPAEHKMVPPITFPDKADFEEAEKRSDPTEANPKLFEMARDYYDWEAIDDDGPRCDAYGDFSLFLGLFEATGNSESGEYVYYETCGADRRPFVYSNDMLYATLARHVTRYDNPHEVSINDVTGVNGDIELQSEVRKTIDVTQSKEDGWVNLEVDEHYLDDLKQCVGTLAALLKLNSTVLIGLYGVNESAHEQVKQSEYPEMLRDFRRLSWSLDELCGEYMPEDSDDVVQADVPQLRQMQASVEKVMRAVAPDLMEDDEAEGDDSD